MCFLMDVIKTNLLKDAMNIGLMDSREVSNINSNYMMKSKGMAQTAHPHVCLLGRRSVVNAKVVAVIRMVRTKQTAISMRRHCHCVCVLEK